MTSQDILDRIEQEDLSVEDIGFLMDRLCRLLVKSEPTLKPRVSVYLKSRTSLEHVTRDEVAQFLHMSSRTLSRKLKKEDTSFLALLNEERMRRCYYYLASNVVCGNKLMELLGLSDISHFYKAFRQWTGHSFSEVKLMMAENHPEIDTIIHRHDRQGN